MSNTKSCENKCGTTSNYYPPNDGGSGMSNGGFSHGGSIFG